ncbi:S100 calcium binding protein U [Misgurnus anguillicaudatus]|uniref:S100 calcium binding protein U n=1 Tax=Misgurnus anguillicaudatus TaxID=75329 RepID=UPI003CCF7DE2
MEAAIKTVVGVFLKSAKGKENLGAKEFQSLVKNQLKNILVGTEDNEAVKNMRKDLDNNQDGKVSFQEYMTLIGYLAESVSTQRCRENESQAESSAQETAAANAEPQQAEPKEEPKVEPQAEPQAAKEEPAVEEAAAEEEKPEEEKPEEEKAEQDEVQPAEKQAEEQNKPEEAS